MNKLKLNKDKLKIHVVGGNNSYANFILSEYELVSLSEANIVIFTGGEDVSPSFYGEGTGSRTITNEERDLSEESIFNKISKRGDVLLVGICRGAQFLTVMAGGSLIQHVNNHGISGTHSIDIIGEGRSIDITSTHHQMMYPFSMNVNDYSIIAKSSKNLSNTYLNGYDDEKIIPNDFCEPEIVYYNKINALCIQGHPEYMDKKSKAVKFINMLIGELMEDQIVTAKNAIQIAPNRIRRFNLEEILINDLLREEDLNFVL